MKHTNGILNLESTEIVLTKKSILLDEIDNYVNESDNI